MLFTSLLTFAVVILSSSGLSSQSESSSNSGLNLRVPCTGRSDSPDKSPTPARFRSKSPPLKQFPHDGAPSTRPLPTTRCMYPPNRLPSNNGPGHKLDQLPFIRLIPRTASHRIFELRRFTFPVDKGLKLRTTTNKYEAMQAQELIVISTSYDDVFAILETPNTLAGMYISGKNAMRRAKINTSSGIVTELSQDELTDTPVGRSSPIRKNFKVARQKPV